MTSRERVLKALNHEVPERIPMDLGGNQTGIHKKAQAKLVKHLGIRDDLQIIDAVQQPATHRWKRTEMRPEENSASVRTAWQFM